MCFWETFGRGRPLSEKPEVQLSQCSIRPSVKIRTGHISVLRVKPVDNVATRVFVAFAFITTKPPTQLKLFLSSEGDNMHSHILNGEEPFKWEVFKMDLRYFTFEIPAIQLPNKIHPVMSFVCTEVTVGRKNWLLRRQKPWADPNSGTRVGDLLPEPEERVGQGVEMGMSEKCFRKFFCFTVVSRCFLNLNWLYISKSVQQDENWSLLVPSHLKSTLCWRNLPSRHKSFTNF